MDVSQTQRERLAFLELRTFFTGELRRGDIKARFGVKPAAASRDLGSYRDIARDNLDYNAPARCYRPSAFFKPIFEFSIEHILTWLLQGFVDGLNLKPRQIAPCESTGQSVKHDLEVLEVITRYLVVNRAVRINYLSLSSGSKRREIVPVALDNNGLRWHIRAFNREQGRLGHFLTTRIAKAQGIADEVQECELLPTDEQWARVVNLELIPYPSIPLPKTVEADYGMPNKALRIKSRAALVGYVLRRWNIDSAPDHRFNPVSHHL